MHRLPRALDRVKLTGNKSRAKSGLVAREGTVLDANTIAHWPRNLQDELQRSFDNGCVGSRLVSETERLRIWHLMLRPGERIGFHRHVLNYFWTVMTDGSAKSNYNDGRTTITHYKAGDTKHYAYGAGEFMMHDLENVGSTMLLFTTVEHLDSVNPPLPIPDSMRN
jgi:beta-alanine degradation protein BauB